jgi:hypothetical protein
MAQKNAILLYPTLEMAKEKTPLVNVEGVDIFPAVTLDDVKSIMDETYIDVLILGSNLKHLASRLEIIEYVKKWAYNAGKGPTIHFHGNGIPVIEFFNAVLKSDVLKY